MIHLRKSIRLSHYDYSQYGKYFITLYIKNKQKLLWEQAPNDYKSNPLLTPLGIIVQKRIDEIPTHYNHIELNCSSVMPNHIHLLLSLDQLITENRATISQIIQQFKGIVTKECGYPLWQKLYYDHIVRSEDEYKLIYTYITSNPYRWKNDCYYNA